MSRYRLQRPRRAEGLSDIMTTLVGVYFEAAGARTDTSVGKGGNGVDAVRGLRHDEQ